MPFKTLQFRRRREGKTDYKARLNLLASGLPRLVVRKSNRYILAQLIKSQEAQDSVVYSVTSKELDKYGFKNGSKKNLAAAYLTGFLLGNKAKGGNGKEKISRAILDLSIHRNTKGSKIYACLKGTLDAGLDVPHSKEILPSQEIISNRNKNFSEIFDKIKRST